METGADPQQDRWRPPELFRTLSDAELVSLCCEGQRSAFGELVYRYRRRVRHLALSLTRDEQDAEEITQDAFLRAYLALAGFRGASSFYTWIHRIVVNLVIDSRRQPCRHSINWEAVAESADDTRCHELPRIPDSEPHDSMHRSEVRHRVGVALSRLDNLHRTVIELRELEELSYQEIAERLQICKGTVMSRLFHARRLLRLELAGDVAPTSQVTLESLDI